MITKRQLEMLRRLLRDYEHCAIDEGGKLDPARKAMILRVNRLLNSFVFKKLVKP